MSDHDATRDTVERLAESFLARLRRGERPSLDEYVERYPEHADDIRELFPLLAERERARSVPADAAEAGTAPTPTPADSPLRRLGDYRILRWVGEGGMGVVYEALREELGSHVALKILHPRFRTDANYLRRFRAEARAAARLHHTNIVSVFDFGTQDGVCYYAMQFISGQGLDKVLDDVRRLRAAKDPPPPTEGAADRLTRTVAHGLVSGPFDAEGSGADFALAETAPLAGEATPPAGAGAGRPEAPAPPEPGPAHPSGSLGGPAEARYYREVARVGAQVADALAYAHSLGILHRDIKPSNLLLDARGNAWVTDFGLVKFEDGEDLTESRDVVGTLRYMAPERFEGWSDRRSDVYALGATLYEMLVLRPAFRARDQPALIEQILHQPPTPPRKIDPRIPRDLETIVLKAMAKEPAERYATAAELADDLRLFREHRTIRARRSTPAERFARWCRRNPGLAATLGVVALLLVASTVLANLSARQAREIARRKGEQARDLARAAIQLEAERDKAVASARREEAAGRDAKAKLFDSLKAEARARRFSRRVGQRFGGLDALRQAARIGRELGLPPDRLAELRDEAIACMALPDLKRVRTLDVLGALHLHPDYDRYALANPDGSLSVRRVADGAETVRLPGEGRDTTYWFGPGGHYLAVNHAGRRRIWSLGPEPTIVNERDRSWSDLDSFSPEARRLVTWRPGDGSVVVQDFPTGQVVRRWGFPPPVHRAMISPDGRRLALLVGDLSSSVQIRDADSGALLGAFTVPAAIGMNWCPDSESIHVEGPDGRLSFWDIAARSRTITLDGQTGGVRVAFHPSGDLLASTGWDGNVRLWDLRTGRELLRLQGGAIGPLFSRDGRLLAARGPDGRPAIWQVAANVELRTLVHERPGGMRTPCAHPAGRLVAAGAGEGIELWDLAGSRPLAFLPIPDTAYVIFDASGDLLSSSPGGVLRWPIRVDPEVGDRARVGPPRPIGLPAGGGDAEIARSRDGRIVAVARFDGALVWHAGRPNAPIALGHEAGDSVRRVAVSPDGRWVATEGRAEASIRLWDSRSGRLVKELAPNEPVAWQGVHFSPDGRWLATKIAYGRSRLWRVGTWTEGPLIEGVVLGFSPDGRFLVAEAGQGTLRLVDPATGHDLARLDNPDQSRAVYIGFTPDGARLLATGFDSPTIRLWDLRTIRRQLDDLRLGEGFPVAATADESGPEAPPIRRVEVDLGDHSPFAALNPATPAGCNVVAWELLTGPAPWREPARALALAERAVAAVPRNTMYLNTLGLALHRAGRHARAVEVLEANGATGHEFLGYDLIILAMARHRLGQVDRARDALDRARRWRESRGELDPQSEREIRAFLAEAEAVLREPPPELPDDPFARPGPAGTPR